MENDKLTPKFLTKEIAEIAVNQVLEMVMDTFPLKRQQLHIIVLVPCICIDDDHACLRLPSIRPTILYEHSVDKANWEYQFDNIAAHKALQLWQGRNDDRTDCMPHLLCSGDTPFWGGVKRHGIVVSCSGVQSWFDKMISGMVADACIALAYEAWMQSDDRAKGLEFLS